VETLGFTVVVVEDGARGMDELLVADEPLVAVLELALPCLDGGELLQLIASSPPHRARHSFIVLSDEAVTLAPEGAESVCPLQAPVLVTPISVEQFLDALYAAAGQSCE
jgi:CheY-like chemotaxis protein